MPRRTRRWIERLVRHFPQNSMKVLLHDPGKVRELLEILEFKHIDRLDFTKMKVQPTTFISRDFRHAESDLVVTVPFRARAGKSVTIYILIEHQSAPERLMSFRVLDYVVQIMRNQLRDGRRAGVRPADFRFQPIVPIVFYTGERPWKTIAALEELFEAGEIFRDVLPGIKPLFLNISFLDEKLLERPDRLFGWVLRAIQERSADGQTFESILQKILRVGAVWPETEIERWKTMLTYLAAFVYHYRGETEHLRLESEIESAAAVRGDPTEVRIVKMTMAEVHRREGRAEMKLEMRRVDLIQLLTNRFGTPVKEVVKRIEAETDWDVLSDWFNNACTARTLKQVGIE